VADGGDRPSQTTDQRRQAAIASNRKQATKSPEMRLFIAAKQVVARIAARMFKEGDLLAWRSLKMYMHRKALQRPDLYGGWLIHGL